MFGRIIAGIKKQKKAAAIAGLTYCVLFVLGSFFALMFLFVLNLSWWGAVLYLVGILVFCAVAYALNKGRRVAQRDKLYDELAKSKTHIQQIQLQKRQEQLNALQSQINPHFLYNTLDTIRGLALEKNSPEIADIVAALASMFKYSMDYGSAHVTVTDELAHLGRYMEIQNLRFPGKFEFVQIFDCERESLYRVSIPKLTLQPIVENAISHGFKKSASGGRITLRVIQSDRTFQIIVSDNGGGMEEGMVNSLNRSFVPNSLVADMKDTSQGGIALPNIDLRTKIYCGEKYGLHVTSTPGLGTDVSITLPPPNAAL